MNERQNKRRGAVLLPIAACAHQQTIVNTTSRISEAEIKLQDFATHRSSISSGHNPEVQRSVLAGEQHAG